MGNIKGIFFDQDGVIIDTERDGHRVAFNMTFKEFGFTDEWSVDYYHELLQIAGGKERMKHHLQTRGFSKPVPPEQVEDLIKEMHKRKTSIFVGLIESGKLPLRPGVRRFMKEAMDVGLIIGVCTTSNEQAAKAVTGKMLKDIKFNFVLAGDVVSKKKPDPEIYNLALAHTRLQPDEVIVVEDSKNGVIAAKTANTNVIVTTNYYTEKEDISKGDIVVTCLGDPNGERGHLIKSDKRLNFNGVLNIDQVVNYFSR
jgi:HAD superfamily hydrolase (TIGR01509 family)